MTVKNPLEAGRSYSSRRPLGKVNEKALNRMVHSVGYRKRQRSVEEAQKMMMVEEEKQRAEAESRRHRSAIIGRILGNTGGYGYWSIGKRTANNYETINSVFMKRGIPVPSTDPKTMDPCVLKKLQDDLEAVGFMVSFNPLVAVRACAALYWDIKLGLGL